MILDFNKFKNDRGEILAFWWTLQPNFGDVITPWLIKKMTGCNVTLSDRKEDHFFAVGSILGYVSEKSVVWGSGSFGTEGKNLINPHANYLAVRGPLTRNKLRINGISCPKVYGDPALLVPDYYWPLIIKKYELGIVVRHSEDNLLNRYKKMDNVKVISLRNENVEDVIDSILECKRILTSSLHGLILSDAYGIPNAWLETGSPHGLDFKYYDYFLSVNKIHIPIPASSLTHIKSQGQLIRDIPYNSSPININLHNLKETCPFLG